MVVINNNTNELTLDLERFKEGITTIEEGEEILSNQQVELTGELKIAGKTAMVIDLD
jgi:hypothetical protein